MLNQLKIRMLALGMALVLPTSGWAEVNFSQKPLSAGGSVDPNLMFILDDSGSMRWGFMPDDLMGGRYIGDCSSYVTYGSDGFCAMNVGDRSALLSPTFNKLYYNPDVNYEPPLNADGNPYPDADFYNASIDGFDSSSARVNLDTSYRAIMDDYYYYGGWNNNAVYGFTLSPYGNPTRAFYLDWREGCGDPSNFNCYDQVSIDDASERTNFANWFSYYRTRELAAKSGIGSVFANVDLSDEFRLGWGVINQGRNTVDDAANIRAVQNGVRPFESVKADFLNWLYGGYATGSTPLQRALEGAGQYYENSKRAWLDDPSSPESNDNVARECRISATMLMTDGYYNTGNGFDPDLNSHADDVDGSVITNGTGDSGQYEAEQPFSDGVTNRVTLADIAAYYWKRDLRPDINNYVPTIDPKVDSNDAGTRQAVGDPAFWQHMMTYGIGFGVEGTISRNDAVEAVLNGTYVDWWGGSSNQDKINDLLHASMNGRGDFFSAGDPTTFRTELENLLDQFLGNSGSATGLDFNVASIEASDAALSFSSYFEPNGWSGDLEARTLVADDSGSPVQSDPDDMGWSAREELEGIDFDTRTVLTYNGNSGVPFRWGNLTAAQEDDLEVGDASLAPLRVQYLRGKRKATIELEYPGRGKFFRNRSALLGAIVNSTPRFVGVPDSAWPNSDVFGDGNYTVFRNSKLDRSPVVYVGANDGMLHGFSAKSEAEGGGQEVLAYVPSFVSSPAEEEGLHYLTQPGYDHRYYVDLNLEVVDVHSKGRKAGGNGVDNTRAWRTVLIGGSRAGAKGIFALDITDPDEFSEDNASKNVLWEFTHPDLGYLVAPPEIAQMEWPDGNIRWTVFVPSGYNSGTTGFFMLDLEAGLDGEWSTGDYIYHEFDNAGTGLSPLTVVDNVGKDYLVDRVYAGDLEGNMWVAYNDEGTMRTAYTSGGADVPYFKASQPITSAPGVKLGVASGDDPNIMIVFGTGKYLEDADVSDASAQYFYSVHEISDAGAVPLTITSLVEAPVTSQSGSINGATRDIRVESNNRVDYQNKRGWYTQLPTSGERIVNYPIVRGEYVYVNTLIPGANPCLGGGDGWVMGFEILRSDDSNPSYPAFENSTDGAGGFRVGSTPSQLAVWGNLLSFGTGSGGAEFIELPEIVVGLGRKGWREMTE